MKPYRSGAGFAWALSALMFPGCGGSSAGGGPTGVPTPAPTPNYPVIVAAGDISCDSATPQLPCRSKDTSDLILIERAHRSSVLVLPLGDLQYESGTLAEFRKNYHATWGRVNDIARPTPGNHEYETRNAAGYYDYFASVGVAVGERNLGWYSHTVGDWHFIALNSNCARVGGCGAASPQYAWLQADLAANRSKCTVAYMHHPFQSTGQNGSTPALLAMMRLLYLNNTELVLAGHDHNYERFNQVTPDMVADNARGMRFFVVGTGGRDLRDFAREPLPQLAFRTNEHFGILRIVMKEAAYDWAFVNLEGEIVDRGSGVCF